MRAPLRTLDAAVRYLLPLATIFALIAAAAFVLPGALGPAAAPPDQGDEAAGADDADPHPDLVGAARPARDELPAPTPATVSGAQGVEAASLPQTGPPPAPARPPPGPPRASAVLPILMYHHVGLLPPNPDGIRRDLTVAPDRFEGLLKYLAENRIQTVYLDQLLDHWAGRDELPARAVALTFDDGYDDNYDYAFPLLRKFGMAGTFFIVTDLVGRSGYMNWSQLEEMAQSGMSIQAHSANHADLTAVAPAELNRQLVAPKRLLEERLGQPVRFLAYPSGRFNRAVIVAAHAAGYEAAVTVNFGTIQQAAGPYELRRVRVRGADTVEQLVARLTPPSWRR